MIPQKEKPCKGTGQAKGYGCGAMTKHRVYGLGKMCGCYSDWLLNTDAGKLKIEKATLKGKKEVVAKKKQSDKTQKEKLTDWKVKLQERVNEIVRLIDYGLPCLAKGYVPNQMHAGHVYARGGNQSMRYNLHNIHRQSAQSNHFQNDDGLLREGLVNEYGQEYLNFISDLRRTEALKYKNHEYHEFYKKACQIANKLRKNINQTIPLEYRIQLRNDVNEELGIYPIEYCIYKLKD